MAFSEKNFIEVSNEVLETRTSFTQLDSNIVELLKKKAQRSAFKRCRLCLHSDHSELFQNMLIAMSEKSYVVPQKHLEKDESLHFLEGEGTFFLYDESGKITESTPIGGYETGHNFIVHVPRGQYHNFVIETPWIVFQETTTGPFNLNLTINAPWAPKQTETEHAERFIYKLRKLKENN